MKRIVSLALALLLLCTMLPLGSLPISVSAATYGFYEPMGLDYFIENGEVTITGHNHGIGPNYENMEIVIPAQIEGYPVTTVKALKVCSCAYRLTVTLPETLLYIGDYAFCDNLTDDGIRIPASVVSIGKNAFGTTGGPVWVDEDNLYYCSDSNGCLYNKACTQLLYVPTYPSSTVVLPEGMTDFGTMLQNNTGITAVVIPEGVTQIAVNAFSGCTSLRSITIPSTVQSIGTGAFYGCESLDTLYLSDLQSIFNATVDSSSPEDSDPLVICRYIYLNGQRIRDLVIPSGVSSISDYQFKNNTSLKSVTFGDDVSYIGSGAFSYCTGLQSITFGKSYQGPGYETFYGCNNVQEVTFTGDPPYSAGDFSGTITAYYPADNTNWTADVRSSLGSSWTWVAVETEGCNHNVVIDEAVAATCTVAGKTEGSHCSLCGEVLAAQQEIPALGHTAAVTPAVKPGCSSTGKTEGKHCATCGEVLVAQQEIPAAGHSWNDGEVITAPGCEAEGVRKISCTVCNTFYKEAISALGHTAVTDKAVAATCTEAGKTEGKHCVTCGAILVAQQEIPALGHSAVTDKAVAATCTEAGKTEGKHCSACGAILVAQQEIPALGHTVVIEPAQAPTCTAFGNTEGSYCSVCGEVLVEMETLPPNGHSYQAVVTKPTATEQGYTTHTCSSCGHSYVDSYTDPVGSEETVPDGLKYKISNGTVAITDYTGSASELEIPSAIEGYPVTTISYDAFAMSTSLVKVTVPDSVIYVENLAFLGCTALKQIIFEGDCFSNSYEYLPECGFCDGCDEYHCTDCNTQAQDSLTHINPTVQICIPEGNTTWDDYVVKHSYLNWVRYSNEPMVNGLVYAIEDGKVTICQYKGDAAQVVIPAEIEGYPVTKLDLEAFMGCTTLTRVVIPESVTYIGAYAFNGCINLKTVVFMGDAPYFQYAISTDEYPDPDLIYMIFPGTDVTAYYPQNNSTWENNMKDYGGSLIWKPYGDPKFTSAAILLKDDLSIRFSIDAELFELGIYNAPYAVFTCGNRVQTVTEYAVENGKYVFLCNHIAPSQLGDTVEAVVYAEIQGQKVTGTKLSYSVAKYCYGMLEESQDSWLRTLLVDLLNYGAAAQTYAWYNDKTLCNAALTEAQKAEGTTQMPSLASVLDPKYAVVKNPKATWKAASLVLENSVTMRFRFAAENVDGLTVKISAAGGEWTATEFEPVAGKDGQYYVYFNGLTARQMREIVYVTIYEGQTKVSNTLRYSIESYAYNKQNDPDQRLSDLVKAMMCYGISAKNYFTDGE